MSETRWDCTCGSFGIGDAEYTRHAISTSGPHTKYPAAPAAAEPLKLTPEDEKALADLEERGVKFIRSNIYPQPCGLCPATIESADDCEWHGLGNCVDTCTRCDGSGIEPAEPVPQSETRDELRANLIADIHDILIVRHRARVSEQCEEDLSVIIEQYESQLLAAPSPAETSQASAMRKALEFYARHEHWMTLGEQPGSQHKILVANGDTDSVEGWAMAEKALAGPGDAKNYKGMVYFCYETSR